MTGGCVRAVVLCLALAGAGGQQPPLQPQQPPPPLNRVAGVELIGSFMLPADTPAPVELRGLSRRPDGTTELGGFSGLAWDGQTFFAASDRGDIYTLAVDVAAAGLRSVGVVGRQHVDVGTGGWAYVDAEGIARCGRAAASRCWCRPSSTRGRTRRGRAAARK